MTKPKTGHSPAVKTARQSFIHIHKCPYRFRFQNVKIKWNLCWIKSNKNGQIHVLGTHVPTYALFWFDKSVYTTINTPHVITFCPIRLSKLSWAFINIIQNKNLRITSHLNTIFKIHIARGFPCLTGNLLFKDTIKTLLVISKTSQFYIKLRPQILNHVLHLIEIVMSTPTIEIVAMKTNVNSVEPATDVVGYWKQLKRATDQQSEKGLMSNFLVLKNFGESLTRL